MSILMHLGRYMSPNPSFTGSYRLLAPFTRSITSVIVSARVLYYWY
jgi:hypothetical protein